MSIGVPVEKLWKLISMPENLNLCHPYCKKNTVQKWGGIGAKDTLEYYNGLTLVREFVEWNEGQGYMLIIGKNELATARVTWRVTELTKESSELSISIELLPDVALRRFTPWLRVLIRRFYFIPKMKHYIYNVVQGSNTMRKMKRLYLKINLATMPCFRLNKKRILKKPDTRCRVFLLLIYCYCFTIRISLFPYSLRSFII